MCFWIFKSVSVFGNIKLFHFEKPATEQNNVHGHPRSLTYRKRFFIIIIVSIVLGHYSLVRGVDSRVSNPGRRGPAGVIVGRPTKEYRCRSSDGFTLWRKSVAGILLTRFYFIASVIKIKDHNINAFIHPGTGEMPVRESNASARYKIIYIVNTTQVQYTRFWTNHLLLDPTRNQRKKTSISSR